MATILQNAQRIKAASDDIREVIDLCYDEVAEDERIEDYAPKLARLAVDDATEQVIATAARTTAGGVAIKDTIAVVDKVYGNTIVWNQLIEGGTFENKKVPREFYVSYVRTSFEDNAMVITCTTDTIGLKALYRSVSSLGILGHRCMFICDMYKNTSVDNNKCGAYFSKSNNSILYKSYSYCVENGKWMKCYSICDVTDEVNAIQLRFSNVCAYGDNIKVDNVMLFDFTKMFGSGQEPESVDDFCLKIFGKESASVTDAEWEAVSAYSEPTLLSSKPKKIVSKPADNSWTSEITIDPTAILDEEGEQVFPNGLQSAGTAKDYIDIERGVAVKCIGAVDLGSLTWGIVTTYSYKYGQANIVGIKKASSSYKKANCVSAKYKCVPANIIGSSEECDNCYGISQNSERIYFQKDVETQSELKSILNGAILYYELATPIEYPLPKRKCFYRVSNGGTERITADGMTTTMIADIAYREAVTASEAVAMLAEAAGIN